MRHSFVASNELFLAALMGHGEVWRLSLEKASLVASTAALLAGGQAPQAPQQLATALTQRGDRGQAIKAADALCHVGRLTGTLSEAFRHSVGLPALGRLLRLQEQAVEGPAVSDAG